MKSKLGPVTRYVSLFSLLGIAACGSLLGIEDVHEGAAPGSTGDSGTGTGNPEGGSSNPNGGAAAHAGAAHGGASGNGAAQGGTENPTGGSAGKGSSGANAGNDGDAGAAGASAAGSTVTGHLIDVWGHAVPQTSVAIGDQFTTTNQAGVFTVDGVPESYDASLLIKFADGVTQTHAYVFQGLTRRDPTLQVYRGVIAQSGILEVTYTNATASLTGSRQIALALAGSDGSFEKQQGSSSNGFYGSIPWFGPTSTLEQAHALVWQNNGSTGVMEGYYAYASSSVGLSGVVTEPTLINLDLSGKSIPASTLAGSVSAGNFAERSNSVSVRFASGATIGLARNTPTTDAFSYLVPTLSNASISFAAAEGCYQSASSCALVHKDGLSGGNPNFQVTIPTPASGLATSPAGDVSAATQFTFAEHTGPYVSVLSNAGTSSDRLFVIGNQRPFKIPTVTDGSYALMPGATYVWSIETHGTPASVDEMAGPGGFIDSYADRHGSLEPTGKRAGDGTFTVSARKAVKIAN